MNDFFNSLDINGKICAIAIILWFTPILDLFFYPLKLKIDEWVKNRKK